MKIFVFKILKKQIIKNPIKKENWFLQFKKMVLALGNNYVFK